jgi:hypothetical protein
MTAPTSPQLAAALSAMNAQLATMQRRIAMLESNARAAQLGSSSIDSGSLTVSDASGAPVLQFGQHADGTFAWTSPGGDTPPLQPDDPAVSAGVYSLAVTWDGGTATGAQPLADFAGVQIHCGNTPGFTPDDDTLQGVMAMAGGFIIPGLQDGQAYYVCLVAYNLAGLTSPPSNYIGGIPVSVTDSIEAGTVTAGMLAANLVIAGVVDGTVISGATILGATLEITQDGPILLYQGEPGTGNLIASWSTTGGTDAYSNPYPLGLNVGVAGPTQITLLPQIGSAFNITTALSGVLEAAAALYTNDSSEVMPGLLGALILGTGTAAKMATALTSPIGAGTGCAILLETQNDGGTDQPVMSFGLVSTPDSSTEIFTPVLTITPYALLLYGGTAGITTVTHTSGSGTIPIPAGVTAVKAECWGVSASGGNYSGSSPLGGRGGPGGGGYSAEPALAVTTAGVAYVIPAAPAGTSGLGTAPSGPTTLHGTAVTVTANPGGIAGSGQTPGTGGPASANTTSYAGGNGGAGGTGTVGAPQVTHTQQWGAQHTYSYEGGTGDSSPDPGYSPLAKFQDNGNCYQGDDQLGDNGNTSSIILWPWASIQSTLSGWTSISQVAVWLQNLHTWWGSGMTISFGYSEFGGTFGSSRNLSGWSVAESIINYAIARGATGWYNMPSSSFAAFAGNVSATLLYNHTSDQQYYGFFSGAGSPQITYTWKTGGGVTQEGAGGGGGGGAGPGGPGGNGSPGSTTTGGSGGKGASQAGNGAKGGNYNTSGSAGASPGGAGSGGGYGSAAGGNAGGGQVRVTYAPPAGPVILASIASAAGTDQFGTAYPIGSSLGGPDGTTGWKAGKKRLTPAGGQAVISSSPVTLTGYSFTLVPGSYVFEAWVPFTADTATYTAYVYISGTATTSSFASTIQYTWNSGAICYVQGTFGSNTGLNTGTLATGRTYMAWLKGRVTVTGGGTLTVSGATSGGDGYTISNGGMFEIESG